MDRAVVDAYWNIWSFVLELYERTYCTSVMCGAKQRNKQTLDDEFHGGGGGGREFLVSHYCTTGSLP